MSKVINIAGVKLTKSQFPNLYRKALKNPSLLEETLRGLARADGGDESNLQSVAINYENDLQHG